MRLCPLCDRNGDWIRIEVCSSANTAVVRIYSVEDPTIRWESFAVNDASWTKRWNICETGHVRPEINTSIQRPDLDHTPPRSTLFRRRQAKPQAKKEQPGAVNPVWHKVCLHGPTASGKSQVLRTIRDETEPPGWFNVSRKDLVGLPKRQLLLNRTGNQGGAVPPPTYGLIQATAVISESVMDTIGDILSSLGVQDLATSFTPVLEQVLVAANGPNVSSRTMVANWGRTPAAYYLGASMKVDEHDGRPPSMAETKLILIDLPGEAIEAEHGQRQLSGDSEAVKRFVAQIDHAAQHVGVIDPLAAPWLYDHLNQCEDIRRAAMRPREDGDYEAAHRSSHDQTFKLLNNLLLRTQAWDGLQFSPSLLIVLSKCDLIRRVLADVPPGKGNEDLLGKWGAVLPSKDRKSFIEGGMVALRGLCGNTLHQGAPGNSLGCSEVSRFLQTFDQISEREREEQFVTSVLAAFSDERLFWNLVVSGEEAEFKVENATYTVEEKNAYWHRLMGRIMPQMRDVIAAIVVNAFLSTIVGENLPGRLSEKQTVSYGLMCTREFVPPQGIPRASDSVHARDSVRDAAGSLSVLGRMLRPALGMNA